MVRHLKIELRQTILVALVIIVVVSSFGGSSGQQTNDSPRCALPRSNKIDEYGAIGRLEENTHLEKLLIALAAEKDAHAFIVTYGGRSSSKAEAQQRADRAKRYLVDKHTFYGGAEGTNAHINTLTCGYREVAWTEIWITPVGAAPPRCLPTISAPTLAKSRAPRTRR